MWNRSVGTNLIVDLFVNSDDVVRKWYRSSVYGDIGLHLRLIYVCL